MLVLRLLLRLPLLLVLLLPLRRDRDRGGRDVPDDSSSGRAWRLFRRRRSEIPGVDALALRLCRRDTRADDDIAELRKIPRQYKISKVFGRYRRIVTYRTARTSNKNGLQGRNQRNNDNPCLCRRKAMWWRKEGEENERKEQVHAYVNRNGNVIIEIVSFFFCRFLLITI